MSVDAQFFLASEPVGLWERQQQQQQQLARWCAVRSWRWRSCCAVMSRVRCSVADREFQRHISPDTFTIFIQ